MILICECTCRCCWEKSTSPGPAKGTVRKYLFIPSHMTVAMECSVLIGYLAGGRFRYSDAKTKVKDSRKQTHNREVLLDVPVLV